MFAPLLLSCAESVAPTPTDLLDVNVLPDALELVNQSQSPVYYFAVEKGTLAALSWAPCTDPATCEDVGVGVHKVVPYSEITGYHAGSTEAVVYHWRLVSGNNGLQPDSIRATEVHLHVH